MPETYRPMYVPAGLSDVVSIAAGYNHALGLKSDGTVVAWGWNGNGITTIPANATNVVAIYAGSQYSLALKADGKVVSWGHSGFGYENVPSSLSNVVAIADHHALKNDGTVTAWGANLGGPAGVPPGLEGVVAIADGLALKEDGTVEAWDFYGHALTNVPVGLSGVVAIARGSSHYLALKSDGTVVAWGDNSVGQTNVPAGMRNVVSIAAGSAHSLAVTADGAVFAWGAGTNYVADYSAQKGQSMVPAGMTNVVAASGGSTFSLAVQGNGSPFFSQRLLNKKVAEGARTELRVSAVGTGLLTYQWQFYGTNIPDATTSSLIIPETLLSHSGPYTVVVSNNWGAVSCSNVLEVVPVLITSNPTDQFKLMWGDASFSVIAHGREPLAFQWKLNGIDIIGHTNRLLQLTNLQLTQAGNYSVSVTNGLGYSISQSATLSLSQVAAWGGQTVPQGWTNILAVAAGAQGSMVLRTNGTVSAFGSDLTGIPAGLSGVVAIAAGGQFADGGCGMALKSNGTVAVWGDTRYDQNLLPQGLSNVVAIAVGTHHCLALKSDGTVTAWGMGGSGQTNTGGLSNIVAVAGGYLHSLLLTASGEVISVGTIQAPPVGLTNVVAIASGRSHNLALKADGAVVAWGDDTYGQTDVPAGLSNVVAVSCGQWHSVALLRSGGIVAWGDNTYGQTNLSSMPAAMAISAGGVHGLALFGGHPPTLTAQVTNMSKSSNSFRLSLPTQSGRVYRLEFKNSLTDNSWTALPLVAGTGGTLALTHSAALGTQRFYRVRWW